jgi:hypothetical protein
MTTLHEPANILDNDVVKKIPEQVEKIAKSSGGLLLTLQNLLSKIMSNKLYLGILIVVVLLIIAGLVLYKQFYHKLKFGFKIPFLSQSSNSNNTKNNTKNNLLNLSEEYHIVDPNGEKILVTPYLIEILKQHYNNKSQTQIQSQPQQKQPQPRPKLIHPGSEGKQVLPDPPSEVLNTEENNATQALTIAEIEELKRELNEMESKQQIIEDEEED